MKGKVTIGTKSVEMVANAASPVYYKMAFHEDYFVRTEEVLKSNQDANAIDVYSKMAFICAHQAKKDCDAKDLTFDDYIEWLTQFGPNDVALASGAISEFYNTQAQENAKPKK